MEIKNLILSYEDKKVIENLNLSLNAPITCIISENGKGKTTLLKCLAGLLKEVSGEIKPKPLKPSICFQEDRLFERLTVLENIQAVSDDSSRIEEVLNICGLKGFEKSRVSLLSGGQKRRVALARAFAYDGDLLLLDEPLKGIDEKNKTNILMAIKKMKVPVIMTTHSLKEAEILGAEVVTFE